MSLKYMNQQIKESGSHPNCIRSKHKSYKKEKKMIHKYHRQRNKNVYKEASLNNRYLGHQA